MKPVTAILLLLLALAGTVLLYAANIYLGDLNQDEGWYLYAAGEVLDGRLPYRDFAFTQGPVLPLVYSIAYPVVEKFGLLGGRVITAALGIATILLASLAAWRLSPRGTKIGAFLLVIIFLGLNVYHTYFTMVVKTYALCGFALMCGLYLATYAGARWGMAASFFSGLCLAAAAGVRISSGLSLALVGLYLVLARKRCKPYAWVAFGIGGLLGLLLLSVPFLAIAREGFLFGMFKYHTMREPASTDLFSLLAYKAGFISRFVRAYFVAVLCGAGLVLLYLFRKVPAAQADTEGRRRLAMNACFWSVGLGVSLVHFSAPFPYDDYQVVIAPVLAAALACSLARCFARFSSYEPGSVVRDEETGDERNVPGKLISRPAFSTWLLLVIFTCAAASAGSSPRVQDWFAYGQDRIWWPMKEKPSIVKLRDAAELVKNYSTGERVLLTQDTYLAVEAGMKVPEGLEMGPFSYYPEFSREQAQAVNVVNREMLLELLSSSDASTAAFSGYGLAIESPDVVPVKDADYRVFMKALKSRYRAKHRFEKFGQAHTDLVVYTMKPGVMEEDTAPEEDKAVDPAAEPVLEEDSGNMQAAGKEVVDEGGKGAPGD